MELSVKDVLKRYTAVPNTFIDELYKMMNENTEADELVINLDNVASWLKVRKVALMTTLRKSYTADYDYTIIKAPNPNKTDNRNNNYKKVMLTPECFKRLCMQSRSKKSEEVRSYFIEVESVFIKYRADMVRGLRARINALERNQRPNQLLKTGHIYAFRVSDKLNSVYKVGRAISSRRMTDHNSSHADDIEVLFQYETDDLVAVEKCVKAFLKEHQYRKYKEVYEADIDMIKALVKTCIKAHKIKALYRNKKAMIQKGGYYIALIDNVK